MVICCSLRSLPGSKRSIRLLAINVSTSGCLICACCRTSTNWPSWKTTCVNHKRTQITETFRRWMMANPVRRVTQTYLRSVRSIFKNVNENFCSAIFSTMHRDVAEKFPKPLTSTRDRTFRTVALTVWRIYGVRQLQQRILQRTRQQTYLSVDPFASKSHRAGMWYWRVCSKGKSGGPPSLTLRLWTAFFRSIRSLSWNGYKVNVWKCTRRCVNDSQNMQEKTRSTRFTARWWRVKWNMCFSWIGFENKKSMFGKNAQGSFQAHLKLGASEIPLS